jgi:hypothetical protein
MRDILVNSSTDDLADLADDLTDDLADDSDNDSDDAFSDSPFDASRKKDVSKSARISVKSVFKSVFKSIKSIKSIKPVLIRSSSSLTFVYLLNVRVLYEKNVIFETSLSHHVNFSVKKRFFLRSYSTQMTTKAANHANDKMLVCHLITLKAIVL